MQSVGSRGYLKENYRLFHSWDRSDADFQTHCHDFHKIVFCLSGGVDYGVEGVTYTLSPWDLLVIPEHQIHRSRFDPARTYERMILWINDSFLRAFPEEVLRDVFRAPQNGHFLLRPQGETRYALLEKLRALEDCRRADYPGHGLMADAYLVQFLITLRNLQREGEQSEADRVRSDTRLTELLFYINHHLSGELSVEALAKRFFLSPSYLMHRFKAHTGLTVHQYVLQKRLIRAQQGILSGMSVVQSAQEAGFGEYSTFLRAFRRMFGCLPSEIKK